MIHSSPATLFFPEDYETRSFSEKGHICVDMDGTLAHYEGWRHDGSIGEPIARMVTRVKDWIANGIEVYIFTARVCNHDEREYQIQLIREWCVEHLGLELPITNIKTLDTRELWDDRAVQVEINTGRRSDGRLVDKTLPNGTADRLANAT